MRRYVKQVDEAIRDDCRAYLEDMGLDGHVPVLVRKNGRAVSYIIETPMFDGVNHVAVAAGELVDRRKVKMTHVEFHSDGGGTKTVSLEDLARAELFPGARSVRFHFEQKS